MNYMDEDKAVRNFIIIFIVVILLVIGVYFFTKSVVNKDNENQNNEVETKEIEVDNSVAIVGTMLQKVDSNYYVILYKSDDSKVSEYKSLETKYNAKKDKLPLYTVDLSNGLNAKYYDKDNTNLTASNLNDLRFGDITVIEVKDGKIVKSYNDVDKIKNVWKLN